MSAKKTYYAILAELKAKSDNAARRNKPTMWAYYLDMGEGLRTEFAHAKEEEEFLRYALMLSARASLTCAILPSKEGAVPVARRHYADRHIYAA